MSNSNKETKKFVNQSIFDFLDDSQEDIKKNIDNGNIDFLDKTFDNIKISPLFTSYIGKVKTFKDLKYYNIDELLNQLKGNYQELFKKYLDLVMNGYDYYINNLSKTIQSLPNYEIIRDRSKGIKLEEIGRNKGVSRERIRQIEKLLIEEVLLFSSLYINVKFDNGIYNDMLFLNLYDIYYFINPKDVLDVIVYSVMSKERLQYGVYNDEFKAYINPLRLNQITIIKKLINLTDYFNYYNSYSKVNNTLIFTYNILDFSLKLYQNYLESKNYLFKGNLAMLPGTCSTNTLISNTIYTDYPKGIVLDEKGINDLTTNIQKKYNYDFKIESALAKIDEINPEIIVWGKLKRIHIKNVHFRNGKLDEILNSFRELFKGNSYLLLDDVYKNISITLDKTEITDKYKLYGVLKYYLSNEYYFKKMAVRKLALKEYTLNDLVYNYIDENDHCTMDDIMKALDIPLASLQSIVRENKQIIISDSFLTLINKIHIVNKDIEEIKNQIEKTIDNGFIHRDNLYQSNTSLFHKLNIVDSSMLYSICKYYFENDYVFYIPYLQQKTLLLPITIKQMITDYFYKNNYVANIDVLQKKIAYLTASKDFSIVSTLRQIEMKTFRIDSENISLLEYIEIDDITNYMIANRLVDHFTNKKEALEEEIEQLSKGLYFYIKKKKYSMNYYSLCSYIDYAFPKYYVVSSLGINNYLTSKYAIVLEDITYVDMIYHILKRYSVENHLSRKEATTIIKDLNLLSSKSFTLQSNDYCIINDEEIVFK